MGPLSPRIAGMPREYRVKAIEEYRDRDHRNYPLMLRTSRLDEMSEQDITNVAAYLAALELFVRAFLPM